ncbi:MAG: radical SAM protein [Proteobacteria bacterium]|nr:radical SAM protein [Pseudomonadota bacterium]MCP4917596.1 radical SAM protein [Pseudomonadota bacterium]
MDRLAPVRRNARMYLSRALNRSLAPPDWLSVNLTLQCNLKCVMCTTCYDVPDELGTEEVKGLIDQAALWGIKVFNPLGGELFMRGDLEEILEYACKKDFTITITTNGTLVNRRRAETIARIPPHSLHINVSFDGNEAVHDSIRGEGMYRRALKGFDNIRQADAAAGNVHRKILVNAIVHRRNFRELPAFLDEMERQGFDGVQLLNLFRHGEDAPEDHVGMWIRPEDLGELQTLVDELVRRVERQGRAGFQILNSVEDLRLIPSYYRDDLAPLEAPCWAGWKELYINANGDAIMCDGSLDFLAGRFGSARTDSLRDLWASPQLAERRQVVKTCSTPCIQNCYLRRDSDSAQAIGRTALSILGDMAKERLRGLRPQRGRRVAGGLLRLELSDTAPWPSLWDKATQRRFESLVADSPRPVEACFDDPDLWLEYRDRQYIDFGRGFLGFEVVERVVTDLASTRITFPVVQLSWRGEPLLHPEFGRILRFVLVAIRDEGVFEELRIETDGRLLSEDIASIVAEFPEIPQTWIVHGNGGGRWTDQVEVRVQHLAAVRGKATRIVASWVVDEELDPHAFVETWQGLLVNPHLSVGPMPEAGDGIWFRRTDHDHFQATRDARTRLEELSEVLDVPCLSGDESAPRSCTAVEQTPTVSWDGKVVLCPWDTDLSNKIGQITDDRLSRIWTEDEHVASLRRSARGKGVPSCEKCRDCHFPYSPNA